MAQYSPAQISEILYIDSRNTTAGNSGLTLDTLYTGTRLNSANLLVQNRTNMDGNVGIRTTTPRQALEVTGNTILTAQGSGSTAPREFGLNGSYDTLSLISPVGLGLNGTTSIFFGLNSLIYYPVARIVAIDNGNYSGSLGFQIGTGNSLSEKMRIDATSVTMGSNLIVNGIVQFTTNQWNTSSDGKARLFFSSGNRTHFGSPNGYSFRNETDAFDIFIIDTAGNTLIGNNTASMGSSAFPSPPIPKIYSGTDSFNGDGGKYHTAQSLALEAQSMIDGGGKAYGASIVLEGGKETPVGPGWRIDGGIKFITGGSERIRLTNDGLYIFSGNVPVRLQTRYIDAAPGYDCMFEINTNYNRLSNTVDSAFYGTASLQVNASQSEGGYISMATGAKNTAPTEVVKVVGSNMNVTGNINAGGNMSAVTLNASGNITAGAVIYTPGTISSGGTIYAANFSGDGSALTNLPAAQQDIITTSGVVVAKSDKAYVLMIGPGGRGGNGSTTGPNGTGQGGGGGGSGYILQGIYRFTKGANMYCQVFGGGSGIATILYFNGFSGNNLQADPGYDGSRGGNAGTGSGIGVGGNGYCGGGGGGGTNSYGSAGGTGVIGGVTNGAIGYDSDGSGGRGGYNPLLGNRLIANGAPPQGTFANSQYAGGGGGGQGYPGISIAGYGGFYNSANDVSRNGTNGVNGGGGGGGCSGAGIGGAGGNGYIHIVWL